jgi:hypothetical protein
VQHQSCRIFLGTNIPKREKYTKWPQTIPNCHKINQIAQKHSKWSQIIPTFSILRPSKIYQIAQNILNGNKLYQLFPF